MQAVVSALFRTLTRPLDSARQCGPASAKSALDTDKTSRLQNKLLLLKFNASNAIVDGMATLTIRQLAEKTKAQLRVRAAHHGRSMEAEAREILRAALNSSRASKGNLAEAIRQRFAALGGLELELPRRDAIRQEPEFPG